MNLLEILKKNADNAKSYIDDLVSKKQDTLTFDTAPTKGSQNPVTSDGIQKAIAAKTVDLSNYPTKDGIGATGNWSINAATAATATKLQTARTLSLSGKAAGSATFDGSANAAINVTSVNADTASKMSTARKINITGNATGAAAFDGSGDININTTVNESKHATAADTATKLQTARTISLTGDITGSATFDGSSNISINASRPYVVGETKVYNVNLSTLDTTKFYPIIFESDYIILRCEIHSPSLGGGAPYNQNVISFRLLSQGWSDTPYSLSIDEYGVYDPNEITIGCIGRGSEDGYVCVWVRGGMTYRILSNKKPTLHTEDTVLGNETYTVGTNYYGGTGNNTVGIIFTPQQTITSGSWHDGTAYGLFEKATKLATARTISLTGNATGAANFDGSGDANISVTVNESKHAAAADTLKSSAATETSTFARPVWLSWEDDNTKQTVSPNLTYTCSTKTLAAANFKGHLAGNADTATRATAADNANKLGGYPLNDSSTGGNWGTVPRIGTDGVIEVGKYIDWHATNGGGADYTARWEAQNNGTVSVGTINGALNGNAATATAATNDQYGNNIADSTHVLKPNTAYNGGDVATSPYLRYGEYLNCVISGTTDALTDVKTKLNQEPVTTNTWTGISRDTLDTDRTLTINGTSYTIKGSDIDGAYAYGYSLIDFQVDEITLHIDCHDTIKASMFEEGGVFYNAFVGTKLVVKSNSITAEYNFSWIGTNFLSDEINEGRIIYKASDEDNVISPDEIYRDEQNTNLTFEFVDPRIEIGTSKFLIIDHFSEAYKNFNQLVSLKNNFNYLDNSYRDCASNKDAHILEANTHYKVGDIVTSQDLASGYYLECISDGTTGTNIYLSRDSGGYTVNKWSFSKNKPIYNTNITINDTSYAVANSSTAPLFTLHKTADDMDGWPEIFQISFTNLSNSDSKILTSMFEEDGVFYNYFRYSHLVVTDNTRTIIWDRPDFVIASNISNSDNGRGLITYDTSYGRDASGEYSIDSSWSSIIDNYNNGKTIYVSIQEETVKLGTALFVYRKFNDNTADNTAYKLNKHGDYRAASVEAVNNEFDYMENRIDELSNKINDNESSLAAVATTGSYNDLTNKPTIPTVPTKVSAFTNDAGYLTTHQDLSGYQTKLMFDTAPTANSTNPVTSGGVKAAIDSATSNIAVMTEAEVDECVTAAGLAVVDGDSKSY